MNESSSACGILGAACKDCAATGQSCTTLTGSCSGRARTDAGRP
jgi:hypothetical protein